jgi:hypothetical protein
MRCQQISATREGPTNGTGLGNLQIENRVFTQQEFSHAMEARSMRHLPLLMRHEDLGSAAQSGPRRSFPGCSEVEPDVPALGRPFEFQLIPVNEIR